MSKQNKLWLGSTLLYLVFLAWYSNLGGSLSDEEIDTYLDTMRDNGSSEEILAFVEKFARGDSGRHFLMINSIDYADNPPAQVEGAEPGESAERLMARYMEHMIVALLSRASHPVLMGPAIYQSIDVVGIDNAEHWETGAVFRYRSRRDFMEIVSNPVFEGKHHFKAAALEKTIAFPIEPQLYLGDLRLVLGLIMLSLTSLISNRLARSHTA